MGDTYVGISEISVPEDGSGELEAAFQRRMGAVESRPGFIRLQVLRDRRVPGRYLMVTEWDNHRSFLDYMRSGDHRESHRRIPDGPLRPRAVRFDDYDCVAR